MPKLLSCRNKTKLLPNSYPGVQKLKCACNSTYFSETKKKLLTQNIDGDQESFKKKWNSSRAACSI